MAKDSKRRTTGPKPDEPDSNRNLRYSEDLVVAMDEERILVGNRTSGTYQIWPREAETRLGGYMSARTYPIFRPKPWLGTKIEPRSTLIASGSPLPERQRRLG